MSKPAIAEFDISADDPLAESHQKLKDWIDHSLADPSQAAHQESAGGIIDPQQVTDFAWLPTSSAESQELAIAAKEQSDYWLAQCDALRESGQAEQPENTAIWENVRSKKLLADLILDRLLQKRKLFFAREDLLAIMAWCQRTEPIAEFFPSLPAIAKALERYSKEKQLDDELLAVAEACADTVPSASPLIPGEVWTDTAMQDILRMPQAKREQWTQIILHANTATSARPSESWLETAAGLVASVGEDQILHDLNRWLPMVAKGRTGSTALGTMDSRTSDCLRGLLWLAATLSDAEQLVRTLSAVVMTAYKKVPGVGPRAVKVGNAAVYALSQISTSDAVGQLAMLKARVKFGTAQKEIEKAFHVAAEALNLPREEIEEIGVPTYGLEAGGKVEIPLGDYTATLSAVGTDALLQWTDAKGKQLKSVPAKVKAEFGDDLKELKQLQKDIRAMLPAQRDRMDAMFLQQKSWAFQKWQDRYLEHPLVGTIASRLLWNVDGNAVLFVDGEATDVHGNVVQHGKTAEVTFWHPADKSVDEIVAWRQRLEALEITQPFKQVYREVYLLTDAERRTNTYSNRFAAHVLRQHQFNALCTARGWKNRLRLMVDDSYDPATKWLPQWGLRAEYWVEGAGDDYQTDINESGVYLRLVTDQVRFYRLDAAANWVHASGGGYRSAATGPGHQNINEPLPLEQIPPLVFSEVMRDVDLFVGVASVGNDPQWSDGGPAGRYRDYWQQYSFGDLSGTATTRKQVLQRLIPRLKIADQCSFSDRFLIVKGSLRTYKIHLGSSNILMEPNDQYLCIVPDAKARTKQETIYLPFEGDNTLSIIISKALLLADDQKIKDTTILNQIKP